MPSTYPTTLDSYTDKVDGVDDVLAAHVNEPQSAIVAIETELGTLPKGSHADVKTRLNAVDTLLAAHAAYFYIAEILALPGLVDLWPMSSIARDSGLVYGLSGQGRSLTYAGNPTFNVLTPTTYAVPYIDFDGTGDYLTRADEAGLDILGSEAIYAAAVRGLTICCWVDFDNATPGTAEVVMSKHGGAGNRGYYFVHNTTGTLGFNISSDGTAQTGATTVGLTGGGWVFIAGRFVPSTSVDIYLGVGGSLEKVPNTTSIPAAMFNNNVAFNIGGMNNGTLLMAGNVSMAFLCANQLSDEVLARLYGHSRVLFGV